MEFEIKVKNEVYKEIFSLMENVDKLNNGDEIGGWLTGDWEYDEDKATLLLDNFIIPKQDVTSTEVDISEDSQLDTLQEFGPEVCNRIKAHWHIHPFGKGDTDWSGVDESKINGFMEPVKGREVFVFLLSSEDKIKGRVELNFKGEVKVFEKKMTFRKTIDNLDVLPEIEYEEEEDEVFKKLKARIDEKVVRAKLTYGVGQTKFGSSVEDDLDLFEIDAEEDKINVKISKAFGNFIRDCGFASEYLLSPTISAYKNDEIVFTYLVSKKKLKDVLNKMDNELSELQKSYEDSINETYNNMYGYGGYYKGRLNWGREY